MSEDTNGRITRSFALKNAQRTQSNARTGINGKPTRNVSRSSGEIFLLPIKSIEMPNPTRTALAA